MPRFRNVCINTLSVMYSGTVSNVPLLKLREVTMSSSVDLFWGKFIQFVVAVVGSVYLGFVYWCGCYRFKVNVSKIKI